MNELRAKGAAIGVLGAAVLIAGLTASPGDAFGEGGSGTGGDSDTNNGAVSLTKPITRSTTRRASTKHPEWINYKDCQDNVAFTFSVNVSVLGNKTLRGYMSGSVAGNVTDCRTYSSRTNTSLCFEMQGDANGDFKIDASTILANLSINDCGVGKDSLVNVPVAFVFELVDDASTDSITQDFATFNDLHIDLWGPAAPKMKDLDVGDTEITVNFETTGSSDALSYNIYRDPPQATVPATCGGSSSSSASSGSASSSSASSSSASSSSASSSSASSGAGGGGGAGGSMGVDGGVDGGASGAGGSGGALSSSSTASSGGGGGGGGTPSDGTCSSTLLIPGEVPPSCYPAAGTATTGSKAIKSLTNGSSYAFAVSATDAVDNPGPLSDLVCGAPAPVDSFWKEYCKDGGQACQPGACGCTSVGAEGTVLWPALSTIGLGAVGLSLIRRRRRRHAGRRPEAR